MVRIFFYKERVRMNKNRKIMLIISLVYLAIYVSFEFLVEDSYKYYRYFMLGFALIYLIDMIVNSKNENK